MPRTSQTTTIPYGDDGALRTVAAMRTLILDSTANPTVVAFARQIVYNPTPRSLPQVNAARLIAVWLRGNWHYVDDPVNRELLQTPGYMLEQYGDMGYVSGDCDEAAILGASLGAAVGIPSTLTLVGFADDTGGLYSHVFATLLPTNGPRITLDVTRPLVGTPVPRVVQAVEIPV